MLKLTFTVAGQVDARHEKAPTRLGRGDDAYMF